MIKCSKCGAELSDDTKFCSYCGNKIEATTPPPIKEDEGDIIPDVPQQEPVNETERKSDTQKSLADKIKDKASEKWYKLSTYGQNYCGCNDCVCLVMPYGILVWKDSRRCYCNFANCFDRGCGAYEEAGYQGASELAPYRCACPCCDSFSALCEPAWHGLW